MAARRRIIRPSSSRFINFSIIGAAFPPATDPSRSAGLVGGQRGVDQILANIRFKLLVDRGHRLAPGSLLLLGQRSEEHTSELQSLMRISYAVFCLTKKK